MFGFDTILKAIHKSFALRKNFITSLHIVIGLGVFTALSIGSSYIDNLIINVLLSVIGGLFMYYVLIRMTYLLSFFALKEIACKDLKAVVVISYPDAVKAFAEQRWAAVLIPIVFGALLTFVIVVQVILLRALSLISTVGSILNAILFLPLFIGNFFLLVIIFFGGSVIYGILIEEQTGIWDTIKRVIHLITRQPQAVLIYWLLSTMLISTVTAAVLIFGVLAFIPAFGSILFNLFPMLSTGINLDYFLNSGLMSEILNPVAVIIMLVNLVIICAFLLSFLVNIQVGVNVSIYWAVRGETKIKVSKE